MANVQHTRAGAIFIAARPIGRFRSWARRDLSRSWGTPCASALLYDPGGTLRVRPIEHAGTAPALSTAKAPALGFSRLNHTALALTVYASPQRVTPPQARLASGRRPRSTGRDFTRRVPLKGFRVVSLHSSSSFPKLRDARTVTHTFATFHPASTITAGTDEEGPSFLNRSDKNVPCACEE